MTKKKKTSKDKNNPGANKGNIAQLTKKKKFTVLLEYNRTDMHKLQIFKV